MTDSAAEAVKSAESFTTPEQVHIDSSTDVETSRSQEPDIKSISCTEMASLQGALEDADPEFTHE